MTYFTDLNTYLHQSSLLTAAYPTTRITTKYSLPRKRNPKSKKPEPPRTEIDGTTKSPEPDTTKRPRERERLAPAATLTLKTYEPGSGICLKYKTDKAAEVGRLMGGLGRLAMGELIEMPVVSAKGEDKMEVDAGADGGSGAATPKVEEGRALAAAGGQAGGGGKSKKKKGKK